MLHTLRVRVKVEGLRFRVPEGGKVVRRLLVELWRLEVLVIVEGLVRRVTPRGVLSELNLSR
jgi:hypothetical protein